MNPVKPSNPPSGSMFLEIAKDQPEYATLPAYYGEGVVTTEWEPAAEDLERLLTGGGVQLTIITSGRPLQPVRLEVVGGDPSRAASG